MPYENYIRLAERLNEIVPGDFEKKTVFVTTGAEAVENAVKIARTATGRPAIIAFGGGFHGRTFMGMSLTGKVAPYKKGFGAMMPDVYHVPPLPPRSSCTAHRRKRRLAHSTSSSRRTLTPPNGLRPSSWNRYRGGEGGFYPAPAD